MRATPQTDARNAKVVKAGGFLFPGDLDFMRKLERERDEARDLIADMTTRGTLYMEENARLKREIARLDITPGSFPKLFLAGERPNL